MNDENHDTQKVPSKTEKILPKDMHYDFKVNTMTGKSLPKDDIEWTRKCIDEIKTGS